ncbi:alpha/beta hydrolase [Kribbella sp. NBC_01245]|uniref:alpha/beta hydrolase family protein n=1 Tax=Kribbella sp. NBC_01245 TaxID=2903578 RepID=UPI002E27BBC3|nr:alpha/beta hydrolase [Kribbella sp. NBC_01245]
MTNRSKPTRRRLLAALAFAVVPVLGTIPAATTATATPAPYRPELPAPTGKYAIGATELHLIDRSRPNPWTAAGKRELMTTVWYPAVPGASGPRTTYAPAKVAPLLTADLTAYLELEPDRLDYATAPTHARTGVPALGRHPVVLYSPGFGTSRLLGTNHVEELVSRGYVVVTIDHTGEAPVEFPGGRLSPVQLPEEPAGLYKKAMGVRGADTRFVLDELERLAAGRNPDAEGRALPRGLARSLDLTRIGMFGYSAGGFTAAETMLVDRRIDAGANLDGTMMYDMAAGELSPLAQRGLDRPFLLFGADAHTHLPNPGHPANDPAWTSFWQHQRGWKLDLNIAEGTHGAFADYQFILPDLARANGVPMEKIEALLGKVDPAGSVAAQRAYLGAFFERFLKGRPQPLLWGPSPRHPEVRFVS